MSPLANMKSLDVVREHYRTAATQDSWNFLIIGGFGSGKTTLLETMVETGPGLVHSFDPGGSKILKEQVDAGNIVVDTRYEHDDADSPIAFRDFQAEFNRLNKTGVFKELAAENGWYAIDSGTSLQDVLMYEVQRQRKKAGIPPKLPAFNDHQTFLIKILRLITGIPCHFIMTGHLELYRDEGDGKTRSSLMAFGKCKEKIPLLFDEVYVLEAKETSKGIARTLLTQPDGRFQASTRLGKKGIFDLHEKPDLSYLIKKAKVAEERKKGGEKANHNKPPITESQSQSQEKETSK